MRTILAASGLGMAVILGSALPASAASSGGAQVYNQSGCLNYGYVTVCGTQHSEYNLVNTASGNSIFEDNGKYHYTVTQLDGYSYASTGYFHDQQHSKSGTDQMFSTHFSNTVPEPGYGICTYSGDFHYANRKVQFANVTYVCS